MVDGLRDVLAKPLADPFAAEIVAVHTRGMERWLSQRLSAHVGATPGDADGVCANVAFPFPGRLTRAAVAAAAGIDAERDPWLAERLLWTLVELIDENWDEDWLRYLISYVMGRPAEGAGPVAGRRIAAARKAANLFDRYALLRPAMVQAWARDEDTDGEGGPLEPEFTWQAELWRRARARLALPSPAERLESACARIRDEPASVELPERLSLFGLTRIPAAQVQVLRAIAENRDVHLFALHPSPDLWARIAPQAPAPRRRADDPTAGTPANPLLRSWGKDARELQLVLTGDGAVADKHHPHEAEGESLLSRIQADVHADREPPGIPVPSAPDARAVLEPGDASIEIHACHGRARQVEVLREAILHTLDADPSIEPRDVIVMCPDIETFAPLIHATFGSVEPLPVEARERRVAGAAAAAAPELRVRLADRSLRQSNPLLGVLDRVLGLAPGRLTASQVLDLADAEPVRRRFAFDDDDLSQIEAWVAAAGVHWGIDGAHRALFQLSSVAEGTWRAGLDRILVGTVMSEDRQRLFERVLPLDDVPSDSIALVGRFVEFLDRLRRAVDRLGEPKPIAGWVPALAEIADDLCATLPWELWQRTELARILGEFADEGTDGGRSQPAELRLEEVHLLLGERLQGRPTWTNFRTGHLTVCTLMPMRSVPHRVVCLLGLDDGAFPRHGAADGDDLTLHDPLIGERDARLEDRQLLLDAMLSATDRLIVTYTGNDERTNLRRPPAVPIAELFDVIDQTARTESGAAAERVRIRHPLQPFDPRNFTPGMVRGSRSWGFSEVDLEGARAAAGPRVPRSAFLSTQLSDVEGQVLELDDLVRFVETPVRAFLSQRLDISVFRSDDQIEDSLPIELDPLQKWGVGDRLLESRLRGVELVDAREAEMARGQLPPGRLAVPALEEIAATVENIVAEIAKTPPSEIEPTSVDVRMPIGAGRVLGGTVSGVRGDTLRLAIYSRVGPKHRLGSWVRFLALTAAYPERAFEAFVIGKARSSRRGRVTIATLDSLGEDSATRRERALEGLATLIDLYDRGMREPLPIACKASAAYAAAHRDGDDAEKAARGEWESSWNRDGEDKAEEHRLVWDGIRPFDDLLASLRRPDEGWGQPEPTRFGSLALRLWTDLLALERIEDR